MNVGLIIAGGQMKGLGQSIKALDENNKGSDDLMGNICNAGGNVLIAAGRGNLKGQREAVTVIRDTATQWLEDNAE